MLHISSSQNIANFNEVSDTSYQCGFDDGYNQAIQDIKNKFNGHINIMIQSILKEANNI